MSKSALIIGIAGQNGRLLTEFLLEKGYRVAGFGWKDAIESSETLRRFRDRIAVCYGDLRESETVEVAITAHAPDEIYNFAAQSQPGLSWQKAVETGEVNGIGAHRLFETVRRVQPQTRIFQASSSDMFGAASESPQRETTPFRPNNPYSVAKLYAHQTAAIYRAHHGAYIACGILYNHESRYRDMAFISQKITYGAACAKLGIRDSAVLNERGEPMVKHGKLTLGNIEATRDWGYAGDYVRAMWLMLQQAKPDDFVVGTGVSRSVRDMCETAYGIVGLDWREHVASDPAFVRSTEAVAAVADAAKARVQLGWAPSVGFRDMLADMVTAHLDRLRGR